MTVRSEMVNGCLVLRDGGPLPAKPSDGKRRIFSADDGTFWFTCPGCKATHTYHTDRAQGEPCWDTNGSISFPSFYPSLKHTRPGVLCHLWVTDGKIEFVSDSTHELAGKTVELPEVRA
jgi:hypothetical protein